MWTEMLRKTTIEERRCVYIKPSWNGNIPNDRHAGISNPPTPFHPHLKMLWLIEAIRISNGISSRKPRHKIPKWPKSWRKKISNIVRWAMLSYTCTIRVSNSKSWRLGIYASAVGIATSHEVRSIRRTERSGAKPSRICYPLFEGSITS